MPRLRVYMAMSIDGYIAGPDHDLSGLPEKTEPGDGLEFDAFIAGVGCLLMGRNTYDVLVKLLEAHDWPYGELPVLVPTHRPLEDPLPGVRAVQGDIAEVVALAREAAAGKDVYLDGGALIRDALDACLVDHLVLTIIPTALGAGVPLFTGIQQRAAFTLEGRYTIEPGLTQLHLVPRGGA